jgi:SAM-dependent methyltransferase
MFTLCLGVLYAFRYVYSELSWLKYRIEEIDLIQGAPHTKSFDSEVLRVLSDYCLSEIKAKLNLQRGGWGSFTPEDLYRGAKETFELSLREALPIETPRRILDIGCGFALYDSFLLKHYGYPSDMHLYLFDKTTELKNESENGFKGGGFRKQGISFYTNLECASDILVSNGANRNNIHTLTVAESTLSMLESSSFDLVFSLLSYGHHYPVSTYLKEIKHILVKGGTLILDLRVIGGVTQGLRELQKNGFSCEIFRHRRRGKSVKCVLG